MIKGIGIDIIEIKRIESAANRTPAFLRRVFTEGELAYFALRGNSVQTIAGCFAAKEAAVKAAGGGYITEVELSWDERGKPSLKFNGYEDAVFFVTISHSRDYAVANVIMC